MYVCVLPCMYVTFLRVSVMGTKGMFFVCSLMKFMCYRDGGWWDSWYKAAKDKVFILCSK
jgi:hypothetical protein